MLLIKQGGNPLVRIPAVTGWTLPSSHSFCFILLVTPNILYLKEQCHEFYQNYIANGMNCHQIRGNIKIIAV